MDAEVGKVTLKSNGEEFLLKSNSDEALKMFFHKNYLR
jgi:hypothetical protein